MSSKAYGTVPVISLAVTVTHLPVYVHACVSMHICVLCICVCVWWDVIC